MYRAPLLVLTFFVCAELATIPQAEKQIPQERQVDPEFWRYMLDWHNYYRKQRATSPLSYNDNLQAWAQLWAERLARYDVIEHRPPQPDPYNRMGENIYWKTLTEPDFVPSEKEVTSLWYNEIYKYNYHDPRFSPETSHFTQMVWKATTHVGCGYARSHYSRTIYVVCNYWPQGNIEGEFANNVR